MQTIPCFFRFSIGLFIVGFVVLLPGRMAMSPEDTFSHDPGAYNGGAIHLVRDGFYSLDGVTPYTEREPGYSVFLAALYAFFGLENRLAIFLAQGMLTLSSALFLYRELRHAVRERAASVAIALLLLLPSVMHTVFSAYRENLALTLAMLFTAVFLRLQHRPTARTAVLAGILLGSLLLTYLPLLFSILLLPLLLLRANIPQRFLVVVAGIPICFVLFWGTRNAWHGQGFSLGATDRSTIVQHVRGEQAEQLRGLEPLKCLWSEYISRDWSQRSPYCSYNAVMHALVANPRYPVEARAIAHEGRAKIIKYFPHYLWFSLTDIIELHLPYVNGWGRTYNMLAALGTTIMFIGILFALPSLRKRELSVFLFFIIYAIGIYSLTDATPRYLIPVLFCYAVLAGVGYDAVMTRFAKRQK